MWSRFKIYAPKTKSLTLTEATHINPGWMACILNSTDRPAILFPSLNRLVLTVMDNFSLFVACNSASTLRFIEVNFDSKSSASERSDSANALTFALSQNAKVLTHVRLVSPVEYSILGNISFIPSLQTLHITIPGSVAVADLGLGRLARLPNLETLHIEQTQSSSEDQTGAAFPESVDVEHVISQNCKLKHLRELKVKASGTTHFLLASSLRPRNLFLLNMEITVDSLNTQMVLVPLVVAIYAHMNPTLNFLTVSCSKPSKARAGRDALRPFRGDPQYSPLDPFYDGLANLPLLAHLDITGIPFLDVGVASKLIEDFRGHPELKHLAVAPVPMTNLNIDRPTLLPLSELMKISLENPHLTWLKIPVDLNKPVPTLSDDFPSHFSLKALEIHSRVDYEEFTTEDKFKLGRYLERLFPNATMRCMARSGSSEWEFWSFIDQLLSFSRASCAHAIRNLEDSVAR